MIFGSGLCQDYLIYRYVWGRRVGFFEQNTTILCEVVIMQNLLIWDRSSNWKQKHGGGAVPQYFLFFGKKYTQKQKTQFYRWIESKYNKLWTLQNWTSIFSNSSKKPKLFGQKKVKLRPQGRKTKLQTLPNPHSSTKIELWTLPNPPKVPNF